MGILMIFLLFGPSALAGGLDINNLWSAKYCAMGGAAASQVEGAQSLFFNPAGLSKSRNLELDENIVTGLVKRSAPLTQANQPVDSDIAYTPIVGFFWSHRVNQKLGVGAGAFVAGGSGGRFKSVDFGSNFTALKPDIDGMIVLLEFAAGAAYEVLPGLSFGLAWRPTYLKLNTKAATAFDANFDTIPDVLIAPELTASDFLLNSFRLGVQYVPEGEGWGVGATFRTEVDFKASGSSGGKSELTGDPTVSDITGGSVVASGKIPLQFGFGVHRDFSEDFRLALQYNFTQNSRNQKLNLSGDPLTINGVGAVPITTLSTPLNWKDQHSIRVGAQYHASEIWVLRAGYVISSQVTPNENANPLFTSPGSENSYLIGAGRPIRLFGSDLTLDLALEYVTVSGFGMNSVPGSLDGKYDQKAYGLYTAISYRM